MLTLHLNLMTFTAIIGCLWFYLSYSGIVYNLVFAYFGSSPTMFSAITKPIITLSCITPFRDGCIILLRSSSCRFRKMCCFSKKISVSNSVILPLSWLLFKCALKSIRLSGVVTLKSQTKKQQTGFSRKSYLSGLYSFDLSQTISSSYCAQGPPTFFQIAGRRAPFMWNVKTVFPSIWQIVSDFVLHL